MVVDVVVPANHPAPLLAAGTAHPPVPGSESNSQKGLVAVTPEEVLGANVLVRVLGTLLERRHVGPVLPVLLVEVVRVDGGDDQARDCSAATFVSPPCVCVCVMRVDMRRGGYEAGWRCGRWGRATRWRVYARALIIPHRQHDSIGHGAEGGGKYQLTRRRAS